MYGIIYRHLLLPLFERYIKGRRTLEYWADAEVSQWWTLDRLQAAQLQALNDLLAHARQSCPYYARMGNELSLPAGPLASLEELNRWPLLTRDLILQHRQELRTTDGRALAVKATGGSSGQPLQFDLDRRSAEKRVAMTHRGYGWAGGEPGTRQLFIWGTAVGHVPGWKRWKQDLHHRLERHRVLSCFEFSPEKMAGHLAALNRYRPEVIVAYTNPLYEFARWIRQSGQRSFSPRSIIVGAEKLHDFQRELIEDVFQAPVFETYGSREFMLIGAECDRHQGLHLSMENLLVEILDDDGSPTPAGEVGNVVITDLFNYGMPFIRYVNGDRAVAGWKTCPCGRGLPLLQKVTGRQLDILDTPDGRKVPGEFFPHLLKEFPAIRRFQVVQRVPEEIRLKLVTSGEFSATDQALLLSEIHRVVGMGVEIVFEFVDDIPLTNAGKLKVVVKEGMVPK